MGNCFRFGKGKGRGSRGAGWQKVGGKVSPGQDGSSEQEAAGTERGGSGGRVEGDSPCQSKDLGNTA